MHPLLAFHSIEKGEDMNQQCLTSGTRCVSFHRARSDHDLVDNVCRLKENMATADREESVVYPSILPLQWSDLVEGHKGSSLVI